jgi:hypothetical protein
MTQPRSRLSALWFPGGLLLLLLLFLPGVVLLVMHLSGWERRTNEWMQERFNLSYHITPPWWASLALFLMPFFILMLYFLKMKRQPQTVPSTFLWKKSIEDLHVNSLFQWLRDNVLLLVQLLTVLVLIGALLAFQYHGRAGGKRYILIIDSSASMSATDVSPNRLEVAKAEALAEIERHSDGDVGMVIEFNNDAGTTPRQDYTTDTVLLRRAVNAIQPTQRLTRFAAAFRMADGLANPQKSTEDLSVNAPGAPSTDAQPGRVGRRGPPVHRRQLQRRHPQERGQRQRADRVRRRQPQPHLPPHRPTGGGERRQRRHRRLHRRPRTQGRRPQTGGVGLRPGPGAELPPRQGHRQGPSPLPRRR